MSNRRRRRILARREANLREAKKRATIRKIEEKLPRYEVDATRVWHLARSHPRWAAKVVEQFQGRKPEDGGPIPAFQARDEVEVIQTNGRRKLVRVPLLRRIVFFGIADGADLLQVADHPGVDVVLSRDGKYITVPAAALQVFADELTGHGAGQSASEALYKIGQHVFVAEGSYAPLPAIVREIDQETGLYQIAVAMLGASRQVDVREEQLSAA